MLLCGNGGPIRGFAAVLGIGGICLDTGIWFLQGLRANFFNCSEVIFFRSNLNKPQHGDWDKYYLLKYNMDNKISQETIIKYINTVYPTWYCCFQENNNLQQFPSNQENVSLLVEQYDSAKRSAYEIWFVSDIVQNLIQPK